MVPFRAFWLETIGGNRIRVGRPDWLHEFSATDFVVFTGVAVHVLRWKEVLESIEVENP